MMMKMMMAVGAGGEPRPARFSKFPVGALFASMGNDGVHGPVLARDGDSTEGRTAPAGSSPSSMEESAGSDPAQWV